MKHIEFLRTLKHRYASAPIIFTSEDLNGPAQLGAFRSAKVLDFIVVPKETEYLRASIDTILKRPLPRVSREVFFPIATPEVISLRRPASIVDKDVYFISQHYARKIMIDEVAAYCSVSSGILYQCFKREYGCSFRDYLKRYRINVAQQLLRETDMTIGDIAFKAGYDDVSLFIRLFKDFHACCPSEYRAKLNGDRTLSRNVKRE